MALLPVVPVRPPSVVDTFTTFVTIDGRARRVLTRDPDPSILRDPGDGLGAMLILPSYGMQALHLYALRNGFTIQTTGRGRTLERQTALFLERMTPTYDPNVNTTTSRTCVLDQRSIHPDLYPGKRWYLRRGYAPCASPGTSNHGYWCADDIAEENDGTPGTDPVSAKLLNFLIPIAHLFGWSWELQSEPWHLTWIGGDEIPPFAKKILDEYNITYPGGAIVAEKFQFADVRLFDSRDKAGEKIQGVQKLPVSAPAGCVGLNVNVTVSETEEPGFVAVYGKTFAGTSVQNWTAPGVTIANSKNVPLIDGAFHVLIGGEGAAHVVVDIAGYWFG